MREPRRVQDSQRQLPTSWTRLECGLCTCRMPRPKADPLDPEFSTPSRKSESWQDRLAAERTSTMQAEEAEQAEEVQVRRSQEASMGVAG